MTLLELVMIVSFYYLIDDNLISLTEVNTTSISFSALENFFTFNKCHLFICSMLSSHTLHYPFHYLVSLSNVESSMFITQNLLSQQKLPINSTFFKKRYLCMHIFINIRFRNKKKLLSTIFNVFTMWLSIKFKMCVSSYSRFINGL